MIQLYDEYKDKANVKIVVVNVYSNYEFIKSLNLACAEILFCEWPRIKKNLLLSIPSIRRYLKGFWKSNLDSISDGDVFFFSASFDWVTANFIRMFSCKENVNVHYAGFNTTEVLLKEGYENGSMNKGLSLKNYVLLSALRIITGIWFDYLKKLPCVSFPYYKYGIRHESFQLNTETIIPYKYEIPSCDNKCVLLFTTIWVYEGEEIMNRVDERVCDIIKFIKGKGYQFIAKGHPRLGLADCIEKSVDLVLPHYVPAEFISTKGVQMVMGINSAAIIYYAMHSDVKTVSLLKMIDGISKEMIEDNMNLIRKMCGNKMKFPKSLEELNGLL